MKSAQITRYGNTSEVIKINQMKTPNLSTGKVLVNVQVAGINPIDWKIREGYMQQMIHLQFPSTLGMDFSGIVKQVGEEISSDLKQGDEVYGQAGIPSGGSGAFSEQALASVTSIAHKPKTLDHCKSSSFTSCRRKRLAGTCRAYWIIKRSKDSNPWRCRRHRIYCYPTCQEFGCLCSNNSKYRGQTICP